MVIHSIKYDRQIGHNFFDIVHDYDFYLLGKDDNEPKGWIPKSGFFYTCSVPKIVFFFLQAKVNTEIILKIFLKYLCIGIQSLLRR